MSGDPDPYFPQPRPVPHPQGSHGPDRRPTEPQSGDPLTAPQRPGSIRAAVGLMWGGAVLSILSTLSLFVQMDQIRALAMEEAARQDVDLPPDLVETSLAIGVGVAVVSGLLGAALWVLNAVFCGRGAQWSRILGTVLAAYYVLSTLYSFTQPTAGLEVVLGVVTLVLVIATVVLLWTPASNLWFKAVKATPRPAAPPPQPA